MIFNEYNYCRKVTRKYFNKNFVLSADKNEKFEMTSVCWICGKLTENCDNKVRGDCHISGKYRGAAHCSCKLLQSCTLFL